MSIKRLDIQINQLNKFFGEHQIIKNLDLEICPGEIFGVIGSSGAGKSTLLRCLIGLEKPTSGNIFIGGQNIHELKGEDLTQFRKKIGMIFQQFHLFSSRTVSENIAYVMEIHGVDAQARKQRVKELIPLVGLQGKEAMYPAQLSGGQKQRVGIARALANHPEILFCDEATSALDPKTTQDILELLRSLNQTLDLTIICITHEMEVVKKICHRVGVLDQGALVEVDQVHRLFTNPSHPATKKLLGLPSMLSEEILALRNSSKHLLSLRFVGNCADQPIISKMVKKFGVEVNILAGDLDSIQKQLYGKLLIELLGVAEERQKAMDYLQESQIHFEVL